MFYTLFRDAVKKFPNKVAIIYEGQSYTYAALDNISNIIAGQLLATSLQVGDRVGINIARSPLMLISMIAVYKVGGVYVPLDPIYPQKRLEYMVSDSKMTHLIYSSSASVRNCPEHTLNIEDMLDAPSDSSLAIHPIDGQSLAYIIYTSGSTGQPKGVKISRDSLDNFLDSMRMLPGIVSEDRLLAVTTVSFDIAVLELFLPLTVGATIVLASAQDVKDGAKLASLIEQQKVSILQATPATWKLLLVSGWTGCATLKALCGGEALDQKLACDLVARVSELWNMYGPTETTVWSSVCRVTDPNQTISIGNPIQNTQFYIFDDNFQEVETGVVGELYIGGEGLAAGYTDSALNENRFITHVEPNKNQGNRIYHTGDLARKLEDGTYELIGRIDSQVKVRGFRVELNEIEAHLKKLPNVIQCVVVDSKRSNGGVSLIAFVVYENAALFDTAVVKAQLADTLPPYMVPSTFNLIQEMPRLPNGKIDRNVLRDAHNNYVQAELTLEKDLPWDHKALLEQIVASCLKCSQVNHDDNFFDLGIDSLQINSIAALFAKHTGLPINVADFFVYPSINQYIERIDALSLARELRERIDISAKKARSYKQDNKIAIIGLAGRFPGANTLDELWAVLSKGEETITNFSPDQDDPIVSKEITENPDYVRSRGMIKDPEWFDAEFFSINPYDAVVMDPQQRVFLEVAWNALENAGYDAATYDGEIGVYAGMGNNFYYHYNVSSNPDLIKMVGEVQTEIGREKDHIATQVSHKLNLTGPSLSIHTACSTGLVAVDEACHKLLSYQCDMALAGAIEIKTPQMSGEVHKPGGIFTKDGHCRPFSDNSSGTMFSDAAGAVVLKRYEDAIRDGDTIHAVILGSAVNHDGAEKKSYLAPSVKGQMKVIMTAQQRAGILPSSISYIEAHGTGTAVGDPIEFNALDQVFKLDTDRKNFCTLGSIKGNMGHPTTAAGIVGLIKCVLSMKHKVIPPLVNFNEINPNIDIKDSAFMINTKLKTWEPIDGVRRCGVSSFGFCGTNAHTILEEYIAPAKSKTRHTKVASEFLVSAHTPKALDEKISELMTFLENNKDLNVEDIAYTCAVGRKRMAYRGAILSQPKGADAYYSKINQIPLDASSKPVLCFVFPGQGSQYINMGRNLYEIEPEFKKEIDRCAELLMETRAEDIREVIFSQPEDTERTLELLNNTYYTQPAIFCIEYALAKLWMHWGVTPDVMIGHSIGEFVCGVLSGVFSLPDGIKLISARSEIVSNLEKGGMLSVRIASSKLAEYLDERYSIAAINSPELCVVSGKDSDIDSLKYQLDDKGVLSKRLYTSHAFHSWMMEPALEPFANVVNSVVLNKPNLPVISTISGDRLTPEMAQDPSYWVNHLRDTVNFSAAVDQLWENENCILLEVGPRGNMANLAITQARHQSQIVVQSLGASAENHDECYKMSAAVSQLWLKGIELNWDVYYQKVDRIRVPLPAYPFQRKRYWVSPAPSLNNGVTQSAGLDLVSTGEANVADNTITASQGDSSVRQEILQILSLILGRDLRAATDEQTFFEMGIDSLLLTALIFKLQEQFNVAVSFQRLLTDYSSLGGLVKFVSESAENVISEEANQEVNKTEIYPVLEIQKLFLEEKVVAATLNSVTIKLQGKIHLDCLKQAALQLVQRHTALTAQFADDKWVFYATDFSVSESHDKMINQVIADEMKVGFDDKSGSLFRAKIVSIDPNTAFVILSADYSICDMWSMDTLIKEYIEIYTGLIESKEVDLPQVGQYKDYVGLTHNQTIKLRTKQRQLQSARYETFIIDGEIFEQLKAWCKGHQLTLFAHMLATITSILGKHNLNMPVVIPVAGQAISNQPSLVGQCAQFVSIDYFSQWDDDFMDYAQNMKTVLLETYNQCMSQTLSAHCDMNGSMLVSHIQRLSKEELVKSQVSAEYEFNKRTQTVFDYECNFTEHQDKLVIEFGLSEDGNNLDEYLMRELKDHLDHIGIVGSHKKDGVVV